MVFEGALQLLHLWIRPSVTLSWLLRGTAGQRVPGVGWAHSGVSLIKQCLRVRVFHEQQVVEHLKALKTCKCDSVNVGSSLVSHFNRLNVSFK